jgi:hypothetical protein
MWMQRNEKGPPHTGTPAIGIGFLLSVLPMDEELLEQTGLLCIESRMVTPAQREALGILVAVVCIVTIALLLGAVGAYLTLWKAGIP